MTHPHTVRTYDLDHANRLIPFLEVLVGEFVDRNRAIRSLRRKLDAVLDVDGHLTEDLAERREAMELQARLSTQLRERRMITEELDKLGCTLDSRGRIVRIPGVSGVLEDGFEWTPGTRAANPVHSKDLAAT
ncbi:MAG: DUF2203 family protein [Planctomycetes bacterium]|nr:DUF2203 family protein [Planctomycetota bacterium]